MVLDGTPCDEKSECRNRECVPSSPPKVTCPNCPSTRGWCTNQGKCRCNPEWDGLNCQLTIEEAKLKARQEERLRKQYGKLNQTVPDIQKASELNDENKIFVQGEVEKRRTQRMEEAEKKRKLQEAVSRLSRKKINNLERVNVAGSGEGRMYDTPHFIVLLLPLLMSLVQYLFF